ncbi:NAD-dependent epimerase/dehydratase family protein [Bradyrhizobium sp. AZCC 2230]|uniref:NAD-dependent epimerase/dehydratase family protein n=1 Tax=Bradyrhizobium sp. AZCC 2230 TaxID=3117021 RepID=UPI00303D8E93
MIERMLALPRAAYGFGAFCLCYFNASGADPAGGISELRDNETHLIPRALMALQGHVEFAVFGNDYDTPDGTAIRDYIHVADLARGVGARGVGARGVGARGNGTSILAPTRASRCARSSPSSGRRAGARWRTPSSRAAPANPTYLVADPSAAQKGGNFVPRHSDLPTVIRIAWVRYQKAHLGWSQ